MREFTFRRGISFSTRKSPNIRSSLVRPPLPEKVVLPLVQNTGIPNEPLVKKGEEVEEGQIIGKSEDFASSPVHSTINGTVDDIQKEPHPDLGQILSVIIRREKSIKARSYEEIDVTGVPSEAIMQKIRDAGITGTGLPAHVKLSMARDKEIRTLFINGTECEPFIDSGRFLMVTKAEEILKGILIVMRIVRAGNVCITIDADKKDVYLAFGEMIKNSKDPAVRKMRLALLGTKYPYGEEKMIIKTVLGCEVPPGKPLMDMGFFVMSAGTVYAIYEAVHRNKPLIERIVTITGDCLKSPANYLVRIGTTVKEMIERYGLEFCKEPEKIIMGGPMMGVAQSNREVPVVKNTTGVIFLSRDAARTYEEKECIRCAKCVDVCPVRLSPTEIMKSVKASCWSRVKDLWASDCVECGACAYICPARIPLVQYLKTGKTALKRIKR